MIGKTYKCPYCHDYGFELITTKEALEVIPDYREKLISIYGTADIEVQPISIDCRYCNAKDENVVTERRTSAEIPTAFYDARITDFKFDIYNEDVSHLEKVANSFVRDFERWEKSGLGLYIFSKTKGSGKTFLASCICNTLMERYRVPTRFVAAQKLLDYSKNSDGSGNPATDTISVLKRCRVLVLDDLGAKRNGVDWLNDVLFDIIDTRYQSKLVTIITSNILFGELPFDERIIDRIESMCTGVKIPEIRVRNIKARDEKAKIFAQLGI